MRVSTAIRAIPKDEPVRRKGLKDPREGVLPGLLSVLDDCVKRLADPAVGDRSEINYRPQTRGVNGAGLNRHPRGP